MGKQIPLEAVKELDTIRLPGENRGPECWQLNENTGCARLLRSLRLPSVARLEFIPMKIGTGMTLNRTEPIFSYLPFIKEG
jgi:hypothetical protein